MFRPPFLARVAAGAAVYALEESRRLPSAAIHLPITAVSQLLQTSMHVQQFVTSLALKGDAVFERLGGNPVEQPEWATFDEDLDEYRDDFAPDARVSRFDRYTGDDVGSGNGHGAAVPSYSAPEIAAEPVTDEPIATVTEITPEQPLETGSAPQPVDEPEAEAQPEAEAPGPSGPELPEVAVKYDYPGMTLAQLRARLRMLSVDELSALLAYEEQTQARAPFLTMLTNRIATVRAQ
ncbi:lipid droplet-associated protein [Nocardia harenae]|uniref:lipid droplet-associated protein n=1 Tax=Nocardia harenae TaxID=358707 RepID=UPI00082FF9EE|nr:lipid droplet-associated protein [Nocardia harenae]